MLTKKLRMRGRRYGLQCTSMEAARKLGLEAYVLDGEELPYREEFNAVFSNAVLRWIKRAGVVIERVFRYLRLGGRFFAECGGHG